MNESPDNVTGLQFAHYNPRQISSHDFNALKLSMKTFGDLSCIVRNITTGNLVGGHQRVRALVEAAGDRAKIRIDRRLEAPDQVGTIAEGYVELESSGLRFAYREVQWDLNVEKAANIAANRIQGRFDLDMLAKVNYELGQTENGAALLKLTGQTETEVNRLLASVGHVEQEPEPPADAEFYCCPNCQYKGSEDLFKTV